MKSNPFIPLMDANVTIVAGNTDREIINTLKNLNLKVIPTIKCEEVDDSIGYHPDIVLHPINHNTLVITPNVFDYYKDRLSGLNLKLIKGEKKLGSKYPLDIAYNVGRIHGAAIHNFKHTDEVLKFYLKKQNIDLIDVNQGYTKCSMAIISEDSIVTADYPIYNRLTELGYDVLLIEPGYIDLKGQKYGFIGGATGNLSKDIVLVSGNLIDHPDRVKIKNFIYKKNKKIYFLSKSKISDLGTIINLYCN